MTRRENSVSELVFLEKAVLEVALLLCISVVKAARYDLRYQPDYSAPEIHVQEFPEEDPWTEAGSWDHDESRHKSAD